MAVEVKVGVAARFGFAAGFALAVVTVAGAQEVSATFDQPFLDRWMYPFNQAPGTRPTVPVFSSYLETDFYPDFDQRDGQFHIGFDTSTAVEPNLGPQAYTVVSARVTVMVATSNAFTYSLTEPLWQWYLPPEHPEFLCPVDQNPCPPGNQVIPTPALELFGTGFRNGFSPLTFQENSPYSPFGPFGQGIRSAFAMDHDPETGEARDVSNNVAAGFAPVPFALGMTSAVQLGQSVPAQTTFAFEIDVDNEHVQNYLRERLDLGMLHFSIATLHITEQESGGSAPEFFTRENLLVELGLADAASLEMTVIVDDAPCAAADLNCDGAVGVPDLLALLAAWGPCADPDNCQGDLTGDGSIGVPDLLELLSQWG